MKKQVLFILLIFWFGSAFSQCDPTNLAATSLTSTEATLSWQSVNATGYSVKWRISGSTTSWNSNDPNVNQTPSLLTVDSLYLNYLLSNTVYEWRIRPFGCTPTTNWWDGPSFTTLSSCNITSTISITNATCDNTLDGGANLTVSGGTTPYSYSWDNGITTEDLIAIGNGVYIVTISDSSGCILNDTAIIGFIGNKSITQSLSAFSPNPLTGYGQWSYDTLTIVNTGCDINIRPEFIVSLDSVSIQQGDFTLKWFNPLFGGFWPNIPYTINNNGSASGYWHPSSNTTNDSTGFNVTVGTTQDIIIRVRFNNPANYGVYTAAWETFEVDSLGNRLQSLSLADSVSLTLANCNTFSIDSTSSIATSCNGSSNGAAAVVSIINGSGSYSYLWVTGDTTSSITHLNAGTYGVIVTDKNWGCTDSTTITISEPAVLSLSLSSTNETCFGICDGSVSAIGSGGSGNYVYNWTPNIGPGPSYGSLCSNTYSLEITDLGGCGVIQDTATITSPDSLSRTLSSTDNNTCGVGCNGSVSVNLLGGSQPYSYLWDTGDTISSIQNACGGTYIVTSTDANQCATFIDTISIIDTVIGLVITTSSSNISCNGQNNGTATVSVGGGGSGNSGNISTLSYCASAPYFNDYSNIELIRLIGEGDSISNNTMGVCDSYEDYTSQYTNLTPGQTYNIQINLSSCPYGIAGSYTYWPVGTKVFIDWNVDGDFDDLGETVITIPVTQSPSYENIAFTVPSTATSGPTRMRIASQYNSSTFGPCEVASPSTSFAPYYGATEDYSIVISSSTIPVTYSWSTGDTSSVVTGLSAGTYTVTVTDTNNCSLIDSVTITEPNPIIISSSTTNVSCSGGNDGTATLTLSGGTGMLSADWGTANPNALSAGTYFFTVTDSNNCTITDSVTITEPTTITVSSLTTTNVSCCGMSDGTVIIILSGGTPPYSYSWSPGGQTTPIATNLTAGTYTCTVTDTLGCSITDSVTVLEPLCLTGSISATNVSCNGGSDGTATVNPSGGTPPYSYSWSNGDTAQTATNLTAGTYNISLIDMNCASTTLSITISEPPIITVSSTTTNVSCNGGSDGTATLNLSGGTGTLSADWGTANPNTLSAGTYFFTITDSNNCLLTDSVTVTEPNPITSSFTTIDVDCYGNNTGSATVIFNGGVIGSAPGDTNYILSWDTLLYILPFPYTTFTTPIGVPAGIYPYGVTDINGCTHFDTITIYQPTELTYTYVKTDVSACGVADGAINSNVNGGTTPYSYAWNNGDTTGNISNLSAGQYIVIVTDSNACIISDTIIITQPSNNLLVTTTSPTMNGYHIACTGDSSGSITAQVSGGTPGYTYLWSDGQTTATASGLTAGAYTLMVTDTNNCSYSIFETLTEPTNALNQNILTTNISCNGANDGSIYLSISGGFPSYAINWGGITNPTALASGTYFISTTDSNNCSVSDSVTISEPDILSGSVMITSNYNGQNVSCNGSNDGSVMANMFGGTLPYSYSWPSGGTTNTDSNLTAGNYTLIVTDTNNCVTTLPFTITEPNIISFGFTSANASCNSSCDGSIDVTGLNGGITPYSFSWSNNDSTQNIDSLCAGNYSLTITDLNGCISDDTVIITEPNTLTIISDSITNVSYFGTNTGFVYASVSGGNGGYDHSWIGPNGFSAITQDLDSVYVGTYILTVTDSLGCTTSMPFIVDGPAGFPLIVQSDSVVNVMCNGYCDGAIFITAEGGDSIYFYSWTSSNGFSSSQKDISGLCTGIYDLVLSDSSGNIFNTSYLISEPNPLSISITTDSALCNGSTGLATVYPFGGTPTYSYLWSSGDSTQTATLVAGSYTVLVSDSNNCFVSDSLEILQANSMVVSTISTNATCFGLNNGAISININSGGQSPFSYSNDNGSSFQTANTFFNLAVGIYNIIIMDANNCVISIMDSINQPQALTFTITATDATCYGYCDGAITSVSPAGGTIPYTWNSGGVDSTALCTGLVNISVTDANGCIAANSVTINEPPPLIVNISQNGNILEADPGFVWYQWLDTNGDPIPGANSQQYIPIITGEYSVTVTDASGCSATSFTIMFIADGVTEVNTILDIYPNPTKNTLNIQYQGFEIKSLILLDVSGNIIVAKDELKTNENNLELNLSSLPKGMYILQLISDKKVITHSVILQ